MKKWIILTCVAAISMVVLILIDQSYLARFAKMTASTGFILTGIAAGALVSNYGRVLLVGLVFSWFGDLFLIWGDTFLFGLVSFLLAHVAYSIAFGLHGLSWKWTGYAAPIVIAVGVPILLWLWPHVDAEMRVPVAAYIVVISAMVILSLGAYGFGAPVLVPAGAILFYLSDISVASGRFVSDFPHYIWGLPAYFGGQVLLAASPARLSYPRR